MELHNKFLLAWESKEYEICSNLVFEYCVENLCNRENPLPPAAISQILHFVRHCAKGSFLFHHQGEFEGLCRAILDRILSGTENAHNLEELN